MLAILILAAALPGANPGSPVSACGKATTQLVASTCANGDFKRADALLNQQWRDTALAYKRVDAGNKATGLAATAFENLLRGQRAWVTYRYATCLALRQTNAGGTIAPMNELVCLAGITRQRTKELYELSRNPNNPDESL